MNEIPELLPCPFCGAAAELRPDERGCHFIAHCTVCDGDIDNWCLGKETATAAWNTRAPDAELAGLRAESTEYLTADQIERLQRNLAGIRAEFEANDADTIRRLRAVLHSARDLLSEMNVRIGLGYDWNVDPDSMTLKQGDVFAAIDAALKE